MDVGQPSYALQLGRVDKPSGLPFVLWPITLHKAVDTRASNPDEFLLFWGFPDSIYRVIRGHTPFGEGGKRSGERRGRGRRRGQTGETPQAIGFYMLRYGRWDNCGVEDGLAGPDDAMFDLRWNCTGRESMGRLWVKRTTRA